MYRKFWLENSLGEKFEDIQERFQFGDPNGLGLQSTLTTIRLGNSSMLEYNEKQLINKSFELRFYGGLKNAYQKYLEFSRFISKSPLYLYYLPPNTKVSVFCKTEIIQLDKGEMGDDNVLRCSATFQPLTFWYDSQQHEILASKHSQVGGKHYELERPYFYSTTSMTNISIYNDGIADAPFTIEVNGECTDIQYNLYTEDGTKYGVGKFNGTFDRIYIDSDDFNESIILERNGTVLANPYNYQDLSIGELEGVTSTFLKLKAGKNLLSFNADQHFSGAITITWRNAYVTV